MGEGMVRQIDAAYIANHQPQNVMNCSYNVALKLPTTSILMARTWPCRPYDDWEESTNYLDGNILERVTHVMDIGNR